MQTFSFKIDKKVTMWIREVHEVEAETIEEANQIMLENNLSGETDKTFLYHEHLLETISDDPSGYEILNDETGETIFSNLI